MYGQCMTRDFIFTSHHIAHVFLTLELFCRISFNRKFFIDLKNPDLSKYSKTFFDPGEL
jgi:hypothetical protein